MCEDFGPQAAMDISIGTFGEGLRMRLQHRAN